MSDRKDVAGMAKTQALESVSSDTVGPSPRVVVVVSLLGAAPKGLTYKELKHALVEKVGSHVIEGLDFDLESLEKLKVVGESNSDERRYVASDNAAIYLKGIESLPHV